VEVLLLHEIFNEQYYFILIEPIIPRKNLDSRIYLSF